MHGVPFSPQPLSVRTAESRRNLDGFTTRGGSYPLVCQHGSIGYALTGSFNDSVITSAAQALDVLQFEPAPTEALARRRRIQLSRERR